MKKLMFFWVFFIATFLTTQAQDTNTTDEGSEEAVAAEVIKGAGGKTPEERAANQTKKLTEKLALSADQATQVQAALLERMTQMQSIKGMEKGGGKRRKAAKETMQAFDSKMKSILNADQYTKFQELREDMKEKMRKRKGKQG
jgi:Spy/CpxP family protein refolding chaperone